MTAKAKPQAKPRLPRGRPVAMPPETPEAVWVAERFIVGSMREVREFFGTGEKTVESWVTKGMPRAAVADGFAYDLHAIAQWFFQRNAKPTDEGEINARRRKAIAEADRAEMEQRKSAGELIPLADHKGKLWTFAREVRDELRQLPENVGHRLPDVPGAAAAVDAAMEDVYAALAAKECADPPPAAEPDKPAAME